MHGGELFILLHRLVKPQRPWTSTPPDIARASSARPITPPSRRDARSLAEGGNALEAMVAMAATIAAVYPHMNHVGGDGFWLVREPSGRVRALMAAGPRRRQCAARALPRVRDHPAARPAGGAHGAGRDCRLDLGARGRARAWRRACRSRDLLAPAIRHAGEGYAVTRSQARLTAEKLAELEGRTGLRADVPDRRQAARRPARPSSRRRSPPPSTISPMPGSTISIAATSGARSPPISIASAAR